MNKVYIVCKSPAHPYDITDYLIRFSVWANFIVCFFRSQKSAVVYVEMMYIGTFIDDARMDFCFAHIVVRVNYVCIGSH